MKTIKLKFRVPDMKKFFIKSSFLTIVIFLIGTILYSTFLKPFFISVLPFAVLFFYLITNFVHAYLLKIAGKSSSRFTSKYMAVSFIKMFFYLAIAIVCVIFDRGNAKIFIANFLILYAIYTTFEVSEFLKVVKENNK